MRKISAIRRSACIGAAVLLLGACGQTDKAFPENCLWLKFIDIFVRKHPVLCSFFNIPLSDCTHAAQKIPRLSVWQTENLSICQTENLSICQTAKKQPPGIFHLQ